MTIRITLNAYTFMHNDVKHMSVSLIIWNGDRCAAIGCEGYVTSSNRIFDKALDVVPQAIQTQRALQFLGHTVELDDVFSSSASVSNALEAIYGKDA